MAKSPSICSTLVKLKHPSHPLSVFEKLSTDEINHIFTFLGGDIQQMNAVNIEFHTIVQTTNAFRFSLKKRCDKLLRKVSLVTPLIKQTDEDVFDTLYSVIMKEPMANIEKLDKLMKKCQLFLHSAILNILCQLQIFGSHYEPEQDELLKTLEKKFIFEGVNRLTEVTATFACIIDLIANKKPICNKMMEQMAVANDEIAERTENGTLSQQSILMRIATTVTKSWDLIDTSQEILINHEKAFDELCDAYRKVSSIYRIFIEARVTTVVRPKEFELMQFIEKITKIIDASAKSDSVYQYTIN